jgi:phosphatidate phosphatase APP1
VEPAQLPRGLHPAPRLPDGAGAAPRPPRHSAGREKKPARIQEVLDLHPRLRFVLIGDSGEKDPEIYAAIARANPGRILAIYIREVRLDPGDGRVEAVSGSWTEDVPFVLAADSDAVRRHAVTLGLL